MPKEPRLQADLIRRSRAPRAGGPSAWTVIGFVLVAVSLVVVGALVTLGSISGLGSAALQSSAAPLTPGTANPTPIVRNVGAGAQTQTGAVTPASTGTGAVPSLAAPASVGGPMVAPAAPPIAQQQPGLSSPSPSAGDGAPPTVAGVAPQTDVVSSPAAGGSPATTTAGLRAAEQAAVAEAFARLTTDQDKVGQLLLLAWIGSTAEEARPALRDLRAGGIVHVQNASTYDAAKTINQGLTQIAQESNLLPPLLTIDHEGGNVQRIRDAKNYGSNWEFAQTNPTDQRACERGALHAQVLREMGFTMNLAPVLDVNNNPANPVIGVRSYSDDPAVVARLGAAYVRGLQAGGVAAVGKHFPGHGNTSVDSHLGLPSLPQTLDDLERIELVPFRAAIQAGIAGIMSAHIVFPAVDPTGNPATLSYPVMTGLLRERLGFTGLTVSDDMGAMKAITDNYAPGEAAVRAVNAGVDMVILSSEFARQKQSRDALVNAVQDGTISRERLDEAVMHVLLVKARYGLLGSDAAQPLGSCT
ncbi:MAG: glycoside hydrolase family 3 N-terminal domain-containing protein [Chloroflexota bacterium]